MIAFNMIMVVYALYPTLVLVCVLSMYGCQTFPLLMMQSERVTNVSFFIKSLSLVMYIKVSYMGKVLKKVRNI